MAVEGNVSVWSSESFGQQLVNTTVGELLQKQAEAFGGETALVYDYPELGLDLRLSYRELLRRVDEVAKGLLALGVAPQMKVAMLATNVPEWVLVELAVASIGAVLVTVNTNSRQDDIAYVLRHADVHTLVFMRAHRDNDYLASIRALLPGLDSQPSPDAELQQAGFPTLRHLVILDAWPSHPSLLTFEQLVAAGHRLSPGDLQVRKAAVRSTDVFQIQFTSGTTGNPKGAMLTHHSAINNGRLFGARAGIRSDDRLLSAMPLFHTAGNVMELFGVLAVGACLIKAITFDAAKLLDLLLGHRATVLSAVPTMIIALLQKHGEEAAPRDTRSLRFVISGGTPIPVPVMEQVHRQFGAQPMIGFGMTEASPMVTGTLATDSFELKSSTVGIPLPHTEVKIVDLDGAPTPLGAPGELLIRGYLVTTGYYKMPERTAEAIDADGWLHSGDLASLDAKGYLRIVGRIKDMIIRGGENVYPAEVETVLMRHGAIQQAQVVGVPDPYMGEETAAFVQVSDGACLDEEAVRAYCRQSLARHKQPKYVRFVEQFPTTPSGKVKKFELREALRVELEQQR